MLLFFSTKIFFGPTTLYCGYRTVYGSKSHIYICRISITTIFRSDLLLRNFHVNDQHIEIFDGSQEADFDSCVLNNFFDMRKE